MMLFMAVTTAVMGQLPDTINCRSRNYFYNFWYDSCSSFFQDTTYDPSRIYYFDDQGSWDFFIGTSFHTDYPMNVTGLSCMLRPQRFFRPDPPCSDFCFTMCMPGLLSESMYLCYYDTIQRHFVVLDSVRWDTVPYKVLNLPIHADYADVCQCHVYEAMFTKPVTVSGEFWIFGSQRHRSALREYAVNPFTPTRYLMLYYFRNNLPNYPESSNNYHDFCLPCSSWYCQKRLFCSSLNVSDDEVRQNYYFGPFHPIINSRLVEVYSSDSLLGTAGTSGYVADSSYCDIYARPVRAARFAGWSDGDTGLNRVLHVTSDTVLTAYFEPRDTFYVEVGTPNGHMGTVTGGGMYFDGETATLTAVPERGNRFVRWNDSVTDNPRQVYLTGDTVFIAYFEPLDTFLVEVWINNEGWGRVQGAGRYYEGEEVKLKAFGLHGHQFLHWGNGSPSNIQSFMACDTLVEAYFDEYSSIVEADTVSLLFELVPNPARGVVTVVTGEGVECSGRCRVELRDVTGRVVKSGVLEGRMTAMDIADLRAGVYFVTVVTPQGLSTRKLAVE